jgi:hypothetical protein
MRTTVTFAANPRSFDWQSGLKTKTYTAEPFPPVAWLRVPSGDGSVRKWFEGVHLTWAIKHAADTDES